VGHNINDVNKNRIFGRDSVTLFGAGPLVGDDADRPVPLAHGLSLNPSSMKPRPSSVIAPSDTPLDLASHRKGTRI
jgi:hypothetical protein